MKDKIWDKLAEKEYGKPASKFLQKVSRKERRQIEKVIKKEVKLGNDLTVLDAGCGEGRWSLLFSENSCSLCLLF